MTNPPQPGTPEWEAYLSEGNATQARKRVAADLLIRDQLGRLLIVDPTYKPDWDLPGGMAEEHEPPVIAAARELREELDLAIVPGRLLCVDWIPPHGPWDDQLAFIFDGGTLDAAVASALRPHDSELGAIRFATAEEAARLLRPSVWSRAQHALRALEAETAVYLHHGRPVS